MNYETRSILRLYYSPLIGTVFTALPLVMMSVFTPLVEQQTLTILLYLAFSVATAFSVVIGIRFFVIYQYALTDIGDGGLSIYVRRTRKTVYVKYDEITCVRYRIFDNGYLVYTKDGHRFYVMFGVHKDPQAVKKRFVDVVTVEKNVRLCRS